MMLPHAAAGAACYVYYRVNAAQLDTARGALATFLADVRARTGVEGSLSRRIDAESGVSAGADVTLMEVYAGIADPAAFEAQLPGQCGPRRYRLFDGQGKQPTSPGEREQIGARRLLRRQHAVG